MAVYQSQFTGPEMDERLEAVSDKVDKVEGKGLSENDFTNTDKTKLGNIAAGAQVNVIEKVKVNGTEVTPSGKAVDIKLKTINNTPIEGEGNIEIQGGTADAVKYTEQSLTTEQKAQARTNIGAGTYSKPQNGIPKADLASGVQTSLENADAAVQDIADINGLIPAAASAQNQLADKAFVNSSIGTATATFRGTYNLVSDLHLTTSATREQVATALASEIATADNNDYCFVQIPTADATPSEIARVDRYKFDGTAWAYEWSLNNSSFTASQWAAINSGITASLVTAFGNKYDKPQGGIPKTDLAQGVQNSLGAADTAYQKPGTGIPASDLASGVQTSLDKADTAVQPSDLTPITEVIPSAASASNQLADKAFVNSSISTATATYRGSYNLVSDLSLTTAATQSQIATALGTAISTADNNDYAFVQIPTSDATPTEIARVERYKYNGSAWAFEYALNNSGFTAAQWAALNSGITSGLVSKLSDLPTNTELTNLLAGKQPTIDSSHKLPYSLISDTPTIPDAVEANPTVPSGTTPTDLAGLKVGNSYYGIPQLPTVDNTPTANSNNLVKSGGVYSEIHPTVGSSQPQGGFLPNVVYDLGVLTGTVTFAMASAVSGIVNHYFWTFTAGSTAPTITWPSGISWNGGSAPTVEAGHYYEISIMNSVGAFLDIAPSS